MNNDVKEGFDLYESSYSQLCYDSCMTNEVYRVFFSVNCENCTDIWFSRNMIGCTNCFGSINLRNKQYYIFNKPVTKQEYQKFISEFQSGSFVAISEMRKRVEDFWLKYPKRFTLAINVVASTGETIEHTRNVKSSYSIHEAENVKYSQLLDQATDSYDQTRAGFPSSRIYESVAAGLEADSVKFSVYAIPSVDNIEYSFWCAGSSNLFGCVGLRKKQYCIFNKQYSKKGYHELRIKIIQQMIEIPYTDKQGRTYRYGEFFPPEFSPLAYNETMAQDFFPLTKDEAIQKGFVWRDEDGKEFNITEQASELPDSIKDVGDDITKEVIGCVQCGRAYRVIPMELDFYRTIPLPIPRLCVECRFQRRFKFVNSPELWPRLCQCAGKGDEKRIYTNGASHFHGVKSCPNEFETSYASDRPEIVYCEQCYRAEVV